MVVWYGTLYNNVTVQFSVWLLSYPPVSYRHRVKDLIQYLKRSVKVDLQLISLF